MKFESVINNAEELNELLVGCKNNEPKYQAKFYSKYYLVIYNSCKKYVKVSEEAEDITQDVFIKLMPKLDKFRGNTPGQFINWLKMISKNSTLDILKRKKTFINIDDADVDFKFNTIDLDVIDYVEGEIENDIKNAINKLSPKTKKNFEMYYLDNYTHQEIANKLNINVGTSKSNLFRGKMILAEILKQYNKNFK